MLNGWTITHISKKNIYHISTATECLELLKQIQESDKWKTAEESLLDAEKYDQNRYQAAKKTMKKVIKQINDLIKKEPSKQKCIIFHNVLPFCRVSSSRFFNSIILGIENPPIAYVV